MKRYGKLFALALCLLSALFASRATPVSASSLSQLKNKRAEVKNNISNIRSQLSSVRAELASTEQEIIRLDNEIEYATYEAQYYGDYLDWAYRELEIIEAELALASQDYQAQNDAFQARIRYINENDTFGTGYLQMFLSSASLTDALNNAEIISSLMEHDKEMTDKLKSTQLYYEQKLAEVEESRQIMEETKIEHEIALNAIEERRVEKENTLNLLAEREEHLEQMIAGEEKANSDLESRIRQAEAEELARQRAQDNTLTQTKYVGGQLMWPVPSSSHISSPFGPRRHPITKKQHNHSGIDITASKGASIIAAGEGKVIFAARQGTYGLLVVVDHGGGISTAYAHCSAIDVSVGQGVSRGQHIAKIGSTGQSTGNHLHFEVRVNGSVQNPMNYVK